MRGIVAIDQSRGIAKNGDIPWHVPEDQKMFRGLTWGHPVLVGRRTYKNMPPLEGRDVYVLTHHPDLIRGDATPVSKEDDLSSGVFVAGGLMVYQQFWDTIQAWYISIIQDDYDCDLELPPLKREQWETTCLYEHSGFSLYRYDRTDGDFQTHG